MGFLVLVGLTRAIVAFHRELERWLSPEYIGITIAATTGGISILKRSLLVAACILSVVGAADARTTTGSESIAVTHAWARPTAGPAKTVAAYTTLTCIAQPDQVTGTGVTPPISDMPGMNASGSHTP